MAQEYTSLEYSIDRVKDDIVVTDVGGNRVALLRGKGQGSAGYVILDSMQGEIGYMTGWSAPSLAISGMPLYSSSTMVKIYDREGGIEVQRMTVTAQSISSTRMNMSLLDRKDNIISFVSETATPGSYLLKDAHGNAYASLSMSPSRTSYKLRVSDPGAEPELVMVKLVAGMVLFNSI